MQVFFCGLRIAEVEHAFRTGTIPFRAVEGTAPVCELHLTEDPGHWTRLMAAQADRDSLHDYACAVLVEVELRGAFVAELMEDPARGRVSPRVHAMLDALGRGDRYAVAEPGETGVLVLDEIDQAEDGRAGDGLTHRYVVRCGDHDDPLMARFHEAVQKVAVLGGITGTIDAISAIQERLERERGER